MEQSMMMVEHCRTTPKSIELAAAAFLDRVLACFKASAKVLVWDTQTPKVPD
jgi:hypothetical protein